MAAPTIGRRPFKPRAAQIDWSHPLAVGLKSLVLPGDLVDLVGVKPVTAVGNPVFASTPYGSGISLDGTNDYLDIGQPIKTAGAWSLMAVIKCPSTMAANNSIIGERYSPSNQNVCYALACQVSGGTAGGVQTAYFNGAWNVVSGAALTNGRWYNIVGTFAGNAGTLNLYYDGLRVATGTGGGTDPTPPGDPTQIGHEHLDAGAPNEFLIADIAVTGIWDRELSANEVAALYADPLCMLRY